MNGDWLYNQIPYQQIDQYQPLDSSLYYHHPTIAEVEPSPVYVKTEFSSDYEPQYFPSTNHLTNQQCQQQPVNQEPSPPSNTSFSSPPCSPSELYESPVSALSGGEYCWSPVLNQIPHQSVSSQYQLEPKFDSQTYNENYCQYQVTQADNRRFTTPNSVSATKRQLIKESLKVTIRSKRLALGLGEIDATQWKPNENSVIPVVTQLKPVSINPEDEERRRRRRERNKVAATKCRIKKKFHVHKLCEESENLTMSNEMLRQELKSLENRQRHLVDILEKHRPYCGMSGNTCNQVATVGLAGGSAMVTCGHSQHQLRQHQQQCFQPTANDQHDL